MKSLLGRTVKDKVSEFTGVVVSEHHYKPLRCGFKSRPPYKVNR